MVSEHDFSGLPGGPPETEAAGRSRGIVIAILTTLLGAVLLIVGAATSAAGDSRQGEVLAVAQEAEVDANAISWLNAFLNRLGEGMTLAGGITIAGGAVLFAWLLARPRDPSRSSPRDSG